MAAYVVWIAIIAIGYMAYAAGKKKAVAGQNQSLAGMQIQTSCYGGVLPMIYGTNRVAANIVWFGDFTPIENHDYSGGGGGKGGGGNDTGSTYYTYQGALEMAVAEGPITGIGHVWKDKDITTLAALGYTLLVGTRPQAPWDYVLGAHPDKTASYSGMAIVANEAVDMGTYAGLPNHSFEVIGFLATEPDILVDPPGYDGVDPFDAKAAAVVTHFLSDPKCGAGWDATKIDTLTDYDAYCTAWGYHISPALVVQKPAAEHLMDILIATNSAIVWGTGADGHMILKIIPYGDTSLGAYTPDLTPLFTLTYDDLLGVQDGHGGTTGTDPVSVVRTSTQDVLNDVPVEYIDRRNAYNIALVDDPEPCDVALHGVKKASVVQIHSIMRATHATQISRLMAQKNVWIRNVYTFNVTWRYMLLEPLDFIALTDPKLGVASKLLRIISVELPGSDAESSGIKISAMEWPVGVGTPPGYAVQLGGGGVPNNPSADPGFPVDPIVVMAPPLSTNNGKPQAIFAAAGGEHWGGANVYVSYDDATYSKIGAITKPCRYGHLTSELYSSVATHDTVNTMSVAMVSTWAGALYTTTSTAAENLSNLCMVGDEVLSFSTAALTSPGAYDVGDLYRGWKGTSIATHANLTSWLMLDDAPLYYPIPDSQMGKQIYVKYASFNKTGGGLQSTDILDPYTAVATAALPPSLPTGGITVDITPTPPSGMFINYYGEDSLEVDTSTGYDRVFLDVNWGATSPAPDHYDVVLTINVDPTVKADWLIPPQSTADGATLRMVISIVPRATLPTLYAAVRAVYA